MKTTPTAQRPVPGPTRKPRVIPLIAALLLVTPPLASTEQPSRPAPRTTKYYRRDIGARQLNRK